MLYSIRCYWRTFVGSGIFRLITFILALAVYCNLGWAIGYVYSHSGSFPYWLNFFVDPFHILTVDGMYGISLQVTWAFCGVIVWIIEWLCYLIYLLFLGGIAKILLLL